MVSNNDQNFCSKDREKTEINNIKNKTVDMTTDCTKIKSKIRK